MAVEIVESGEKCPGQANGDDGDEDVFEEGYEGPTLNKDAATAQSPPSLSSAVHSVYRYRRQQHKQAEV